MYQVRGTWYVHNAYNSLGEFGVWCANVKINTINSRAIHTQGIKYQYQAYRLQRCDITQSERDKAPGEASKVPSYFVPGAAVADHMVSDTSTLVQQ